MPLPPFTEHGLLPEGVHDCSIAELAARFGSFQSSDRRPKLFERLEQWIAELRRTTLAREVIIDGKFRDSEAGPE